MKVLIISTDRKLFEKDSAVLSRFKKYAAKMEELHVIVFTLRREMHADAEIGNLHVYPTNSLSRWLYVKDAKKLGKRIISKNRFEKGNSVISTQDAFQTAHAGAYLAQASSFPLQVQIHTDFLSPYFSGFLNSIRRFIASKVLPKARGIRVVSNAVKESILKKYKNLPARIDVLPVFVDIEKIIAAEPSRDIRHDFPDWKFIIFMASRLSKEKRFDTALEALRKIVDLYPHAGLVIAGAGPEKGNIEKKAIQLKLQKNIALIGWKNDLVSYMKTCNVFLLTSEYEGYGMTLIEAAASGAMIVTTEVGIAKGGMFIDEVNCHVCPVGDYGCITNRIVDVIRDNQKRELFAQRIQEAVKGKYLTEEEYSAEYVGLLEKLLQ